MNVSDKVVIKSGLFANMSAQVIEVGKGSVRVTIEGGPTTAMWYLLSELDNVEREESNVTGVWTDYSYSEARYDRVQVAKEKLDELKEMSPLHFTVKELQFLLDPFKTYGFSQGYWSGSIVDTIEKIYDRVTTNKLGDL